MTLPWLEARGFLILYKYEIKKPPTQMPSRTKAKGVCNRGFLVGAVNFLKKSCIFGASLLKMSHPRTEELDGRRIYHHHS